MLVSVAACGRIAFDAHGDAAGQTSDGPGVDAAVNVSCVGLANNCGPAGTASCCATLPVPGGTFDRGHDVAIDAMYPDTTHPATVSAFHLDTYEVTVGRFRQFVIAGMGTQATAPAAGAGAHANTAGSGWNASFNASLPATTAALTAAMKCDATFQTWTDTPGTGDDRPINCVTWFEAFAFCIWDGGYLPTEAEWNFAAAGGSDQRAYPWSAPAGSLTIDCTYSDYTPTPACVSAGPNRVGAESPKGDGKWGQADLGSNVFEWTLDWMAAYSNPCVDCANLVPTAMRTLRGGDFGDPAINLRTAYRGNAGTPTNRDSGVGVRCARP